MLINDKLVSALYDIDDCETVEPRVAYSPVGHWTPLSDSNCVVT